MKYDYFGSFGHIISYVFWLFKRSKKKHNPLANAYLYILNRLILAVIFAKAVHTTFIAFWFSCVTDSSAMKYEPMTKIIAFFWWKNISQYLFYLICIFNRMKTKSLGYPYAMSINNHSRLSKNIPNN